MTDPSVSEAADYAGLIAEICNLTSRRHDEREISRRIFERMGWETTVNGKGYMMRQPGNQYWRVVPRILDDFGTAVHYTVGNRYGSLDHPLEQNWYVMQMGETSEIVSPTGTRIAAWAVSLAKVNKGLRHSNAVAITPAAALVAAWLRAHP